MEVRLSQLGTYPIIGILDLSDFFRNNFPTPGVYKKYPRSGIFWHHSKSYKDVEKTLKRVLRFSNRNWAKIVQKYSSEIIFKSYKSLDDSFIAFEASKVFFGSLHSIVAHPSGEITE